MKEQELIEEIKKLNVGKLDYAQNASKRCRTTNIQDTFLQGFRFARNSLQKQKGKLIQSL